MICGERLTDLVMSFPQRSGQGGDYDIQIHLKIIAKSNRSVHICSQGTGHLVILNWCKGELDRNQESVSSDEDREGLEYVSWRISINREL